MAMKKFITLLFLIAMFTVGAWAQDPISGTPNQSCGSASEGISGCVTTLPPANGNDDIYGSPLFKKTVWGAMPGEDFTPDMIAIHRPFAPTPFSGTITIPRLFAPIAPPPLPNYGWGLLEFPLHTTLKLLNKFCKVPEACGGFGFPMMVDIPGDPFNFDLGTGPVEEPAVPTDDDLANGSLVRKLLWTESKMTYLDSFGNTDELRAIGDAYYGRDILQGMSPGWVNGMMETVDRVLQNNNFIPPDVPTP
jgi:hypothetical protein